jgi:hypothetical protein
VTPTERVKRITDIFQIAVQLPPEERERFVQRECRGDDTLVQELKLRLAQAQVSAAPTQRIGRYAITAEIGSGGFGRVYRALDPTFNRVVAIKVLTAPGDTDLVRRFRAEAETVANLHHKNIVTVYDFGEENGTPYLVMEYLNGTTLQELIARNSLSLLEKLEIMCETADGLHHAHQHGITHRDVKPANIMRLADGSVKVLDFGIARLAASGQSTRLTRTGFVVGSLTYMAPEQFGGVSDALSDVFGFGVTFYELLTGRNPFGSSDPAQVIYLITNTNPPPVRSLVPECPEAVDRILTGALAKSREARYSSLSDVMVDTRAVLPDLRRNQAARLCAQAARLFESGELDAAKSAVRKSLDLDPAHADARSLRLAIEQALRPRESAARAASLMDKAETELRERRYPEAAETLGSVRQSTLSDPQLMVRLMSAETQLADAQRFEQLIAQARENLKDQKLTEACRTVSEVLRADPANTTGRTLLQEIRGQMDAREARRRMEEDLARADGLLLTGDTDRALALVAELQRRYPASAEVFALRARADAQKAQESAGPLAQPIAEIKALLKANLFDQAVAKIGALLGGSPQNAELLALRKYAEERLATERLAAPRLPEAAPRLAEMGLPPVQTASRPPSAVAQPPSREEASPAAVPVAGSASSPWPAIRHALMQPVTWLAAAGTLVILIGGFAISNILRHRPPPPPTETPTVQIQSSPSLPPERAPLASRQPLPAAQATVDAAASPSSVPPDPTSAVAAAPTPVPSPGKPAAAQAHSPSVTSTPTNPVAGAPSAAAPSPTLPAGNPPPGSAATAPAVNPPSSASGGTVPAGSPPPGAPAASVPAGPAGVAPATAPAKPVAPARTIASLADVATVSIEADDPEFGSDFADEIRHQLGPRFRIVAASAGADAVLSLTLQTQAGGGLGKLGRAVGVAGKGDAQAILRDPRTSHVFWQGASNEHDPLARGDNRKRLAERLVRDLKKAMIK